MIFSIKHLLKMLTFLFVLILTALPIQAENLQLVMPKIIYIGDTVEVRYIFHSNATIFDGDFAVKPSTKLSLRTDFDYFRLNASDFTVTSANLEKLNSEYTLTLNLIPWKTGFCVIPPFNLANLVRFTLESEGIFSTSASNFPFIVSLSPIEVKSLVKKTGIHNFLPQSGPLTLPGTTFFLVILAIISMIIFAALIYTLLHLPKIAHFIENFTYLYSLKKNSRKTIKKLLNLQKESEKITSDKEYASQIQHILRNFLNKRFGTDFSSVTTSGIAHLFNELMGGDLNENQAESIETLQEIFNRLDFIRFAQNARFLPAGENSDTSERSSITEKAVHLVESFDLEGEE